MLYPVLPSTMTGTSSPILRQPNLQGEHQKPGESGVLPPSHQVSPLQFEVSLVPSLHHHQPGISSSFSGHVLITCKGWNHRPAVENQAHLRKACKKMEMGKVECENMQASYFSLSYNCRKSSVGLSSMLTIIINYSDIWAAAITGLWVSKQLQ